MINNNPANSEKVILDLIKNRWSPLAFSNKKISNDQVMTLLDAARWSPSSFNEQPWKYIVGYHGDDNFEKISTALAEGNSWAKNAGVLMVSVAKTFFDHKHRDNRHYGHDTGAASVLMHLQATDMGLYMHQMAGFDLGKIRESFGIEEGDYEPMAAIAIGYPGEHKALPEDLREREKSLRSRKGLDEMIWE